MVDRSRSARLIGLPVRSRIHTDPHKLARTVILLALAVGSAVSPRSVFSQVAINPDVAALARMPLVDSSSLRKVVGQLAGRSGKLLARFVAPPRSIAIPPFSSSISYTAKALPGIQEVVGASSLGRFSLITMRSFRDKIAGSVGGYRIGFWPEEKGRAPSESYENPEGFIEVTRENQDTRISEHFKLRDFLTHDQKDVWPKYLVLREPLVDKLELVIQDLKNNGIPVRNVQVLSGFRTPQYNRALGDGSGRARDSRHQFGDAADIFIDSNLDGRMDDLNNDGRMNFADTRVVLAAVERVERAFPELVGGVGLYHATGSHGPFAHIDVRGSRVRWATAGRRAGSGRRQARRPTSRGKKTKRVAAATITGKASRAR